MPKKYTDEFLEEVYKYMQDTNLGVSAVAKHFNVDRGTLSARLKEKYDNVISRKDGKLDIDSTFFNIIDTEHKAYWLGFLTADGYVSSKRTAVELCLAEIDKHHIELFKEDIKSSHKIIKKKTLLNNKEFISYRLTFRDKEMNSALQSLGLNNDKSYNSYIPFESIPSDLMQHYIRGLMDGDGCISYMNNNRIKVCICTTASLRMANDIIFYFKKELNIDIKTYTDNNSIHDLCIYKQEDVQKFYNWLYKDSTIYLERKYSKFAVLEERHRDF